MTVNEPETPDSARPETSGAGSNAETGDRPRGRGEATRILTGWWHDLVIALAFLTILPVKPKLPEEPGVLPEEPGVPPEAPQDARAALRFGARAFPLAGLVIGLLGAFVYAIASTLNLPPEAAAFIAIGAMTVFTGALHEDGLADFADGAGTSGEPEKRLAIMRDSRIGTFGTLVLIIAVGIKAGTITALGWSDQVAVMLIGSAAASRAFLPALMRFMTLARSDGLAVMAGRPEENQVVLAALLGAALALLFLGPAAGIVALIAGGLAAAAVAWLAKRRLGGVTGDVLGAAQQAAETAMMLAVVALA